MIKFKAIISRFGKKGDKSGWTFIEIPASVSEKINPGYKKAYRVCGSLDQVAIKGISLTPMGEGNFILSINANLRKKISKEVGETLQVILKMDFQDPPLSTVFLAILQDDRKALAFFNTLAKSHQRYFSNWIESAKTEETKARRIAQALDGLAAALSYGEMIRLNKKKNK